MTADGAVDHIEKLAQRYLGGPYPWYGGRDQTRLVTAARAARPRRTPPTRELEYDPSYWRGNPR